MIANVDKLTKIVTFIKLLIVQNAYLNIYIINRKCLKYEIPSMNFRYIYIRYI